MIIEITQYYNKEYNKNMSLMLTNDLTISYKLKTIVIL